MDFLKSIHNVVYFRCNGKRFYLKSGVHQASSISPAQFDIYMEYVIAEVFVLNYKSGTGYTLIYTRDSVTPAP